MKRLAASGISKLFQICKCFRKDERGKRHLLELTMLEWYSCGQTYEDLMNQCRGLIQHVASAMGEPDRLLYRNSEISLADPWDTITVEQAFTSYTDISMEKALAMDRFDELMAFSIEPELGKIRPSFLKDYPAQLGALARLKKGSPSIAERFELYIAGIELANGFSELTDPVEQRLRFEKELQLRYQSGKQPLPMPEPFLNDLASMPETAGIALGMDRLVMLFADTDTIDDVVSFTPEEL